jgi:hypothetical protein
MPRSGAPRAISPHILWLQERFPAARYEDVTGLCKLANLDEVKEQDYSLNPGRYVGVVIEEDGKTEEEFVEQLVSIQNQLDELNNFGALLHANIRANTPLLGRCMKYQPWPIVTLGSRTRFISGGTPSKSEERFWGGDIPWISSAEMAIERIRETTHWVTEDGVRNGTRLVPKNTVLVVVRGMSLANECRVSLTTRWSTFNQDVKALILSSDLDPAFVFYYLKSQKLSLRDAASEAGSRDKKA